MRKPFLVLTLVSVVAGACGSSAATTAPGGISNPPPNRAATAAPTAAPYAPPAQPVYPSAAPSAANQYPYPTYPAYPPNASPTPYDTTTYTDPGQNPTIDTTRDHRSTFGLDVDTASYGIARRYVADGNLPDPSSVRVEEFVNAFDQGYAPPLQDTFAIYADGAPSPFLSEDELLLRVGIKSRQLLDRVRPPAALTFVVDVSGSMAREDRLELVKWSLSILVDALKPEDRVGIVVFGDSARVVLPPTPASRRDDLLRAIASLQPEGSTNTEAGLRLGYDMARETVREGGINRVILASDGVANVGATDPETILSRIRRPTDTLIQLVTVGFGMGNYNDTLMEQLADKGDGFYAYVNTPEDARALFLDHLTQTLDTVALDARVQVDFDPATVATYRLIGYENRALPDRAFRNDNVQAGAIGAGHAVTALYAIRLTGGPRGDDGGGRIATVNLRWIDPDTSRAQEIASDVRTVNVVSSLAAAAPTFQLDALVAAAAEHFRGSEAGAAYRLRDVLVAAEQAGDNLPQTEQAREFVQFLRDATRLER
jgi:Ca-activated chloride channel family protein